MCEQWSDGDYGFLGYRQMAIEYGCLAAAPTLSEEDKERMGQILALAVEEALLDFWINEIEQFLIYQTDFRGL